MSCNLSSDGSFESDKYEAASLDYGFNWDEYLESGETIISSVWEQDGDVTLSDEANTSTQTKVVISGGTISTIKIKVTNRVTTSAGRIDERNIFLCIK